jgi:hypothetical protein
VHELDRVLDRDDVLEARVRLMWSIIAASVVDLPEPVVPVTRTIPRCSSASWRAITGQPSSSIVRIRVSGIARATSETPPRWRKALMRKRAGAGVRTVYAKSASCSHSNSAIRLSGEDLVEQGARVGDPQFAYRLIEPAKLALDADCRSAAGLDRQV